MKAISLWQPWATLWSLADPDEKLFETRHWYTAHRGPLLVHAAKKQDGDVREAMEDPYFMGRLVAHAATTLTFGALIGVVNLVGCCRMDRMPPPSEREGRAGNWTPERFAWERAPGARLFARPVPWKGAQGFFDVPPDVVAEGQ